MFTFLKHRLQVLRHMEGSLRFRLDLVYSNTIGNFNQRQALREVDVKDTLLFRMVSNLSPFTTRLTTSIRDLPIP